MRRKALVALLMAVVAGVAAISVVLGQPNGGAEEEIDQEVASYAADQGISLSESAYRIDVMRNAQDFVEPIRAAYPSRFAQAGFEHKPEFKIVIYFYGQDDNDVDAARRKAASTGAPIEIRPGALHTEEALNAALMGAINELPRGSVGGFYSIPDGTVSLFVQPEFDLGELAVLEAALTAKYQVQFIVQRATNPHSGEPLRLDARPR